MSQMQMTQLNYRYTVTDPGKNILRVINFIIIAVDNYRTSFISVLTLETTQDLVSMNLQCVSSIPCLAPPAIVFMT